MRALVTDLRDFLRFPLLIGLAFACSGCAPLFRWRPAEGPVAASLPNPLFVPVRDREVVFNQTVDAIDDHFQIKREERVKSQNGILTEGHIETLPKISSTLLEPWRTDAANQFEKVLGTFQTIRRQADVRVIPAQGGYLLNVVVLKELEDLDKPENATAGAATVRHDGTLVRQVDPNSRFSVTYGWLPRGRDLALEQQILADLKSRLCPNELPTEIVTRDPESEAR